MGLKMKPAPQVPPGGSKKDCVTRQENIERARRDEPPLCEKTQNKIPLEKDAQYKLAVKAVADAKVK